MKLHPKKKKKIVKLPGQRLKKKAADRFWIFKLNLKTVAIGIIIDFAVVFLFWSIWAAVVIFYPQYKLKETNDEHHEILKKVEELNAKELENPGKKNES